MPHSSPKVRLLVATCLVVAGGFLGQPKFAIGQPDPGKYSAADFAVDESRGHKVAMRDGVRLSIDLYRPKHLGRFPAILFHTPYSNNLPTLVKRARWFASRGYAVVLSDARGRYDSEGEWDPFHAKHKTDGYDVVEWAAKETWCTGSVGMLGTSYGGWTQWWTATQGPPSLKAIVPEVAPPDQFLNAPYQQGVLTCWIVDWAANNAGRTFQVRQEGPYGGFAADRLHEHRVTPYLKLNEQRGVRDAPFYRTWIEQNLSTSEYWRGIAYQTPESYAKVTVPTLNITGWFDANHPGAPANYLGVKQHGATEAARKPKLVIGPWVHSYNSAQTLAGIDYGPQAVLDMDGYICRWFDQHLRGVESGITEEPAVQLFVMGRNQWRAEKDWPIPDTQWTKYFLHSEGKANTLKGNGTLNTTPPTAEPPDAYHYDPSSPSLSPFTGGHIDGANDTRDSARNPDVLVYTTPVLTEPVEVVGPIEAKLFASTSARDTDWMVRLVDVSPDGRGAFLCDGVIRARCRDPERNGAFNSTRLSEIVPDKIYEYTIAFWRGTGNQFQKGHRIRVEISSSLFPYYLPNLNTGADNVGLETVGEVAHQKVFHDAEHPSHIVLPVVPVR